MDVQAAVSMKDFSLNAVPDVAGKSIQNVASMRAKSIQE